MARTTLRRSLTALAGAGALLLTAACGAITDGNSNGGSDDDATVDAVGFQLAPYIQDAVDAGETLEIRLSYHDPSLAFAVPIREGMQRAAEELNVNAEMIGPAGGDAADQVSELQTLINQQAIHGLAVSSASNDALMPVIQQAYDAGIPIISFNTNNPDSEQMGFVGQDLVASGEALAQELLNVLDDETGKVVVFSVDSGAGWSNDRFAGFEAGIEGADLEVVGPVNTGNEPTAAYNTIESTMAGQSEALALVSLDCCSFTAGAQWIEQSDNTGEIHAIGFDVQPQTVGFLERGVADLTISQAPAEQGYQSVKLLVDFLMDGSEITDVDTGVLVVTPENVADVPVEG